jgi:hypothetical protein
MIGEHEAMRFFARISSRLCDMAPPGNVEGVTIGAQMR